MIFGILKDIKEEEFRVICTPMEVHSIRAAGHEVWAQHDCGRLAGFSDEAYAAAGARIVETAEELYAGCDMVAKVKEFTPAECAMMHPGQIVLGCIHPAAHPEEVDALLKSKCIAFTAEDSHRYGSPNCEAAGKEGALLGLESMLTVNGGKGKYVGGFAGAPGMNVLILGGGTVGQAALQVLHALGAKCTVMDTPHPVQPVPGHHRHHVLQPGDHCLRAAPDGHGAQLRQVAQGAHRLPDHQGDAEADGARLRAGGHLQR